MTREQISTLEPLLEEVYAGGEAVKEHPSIERIRERRDDDLKRLDPGVKRLLNPHRYHVSVTQRLWEVKQALAPHSRALKRLQILEHVWHQLGHGWVYEHGLLQLGVAAARCTSTPREG